MIRVTYHLTRVQLDRLRAIARETGLSVAELIRRAIDAFIDRREAKNQ
jgi:predicted transcriptional regulator